MSAETSFPWSIKELPPVRDADAYKELIVTIISELQEQRVCITHVVSDGDYTIRKALRLACKETATVETVCVAHALQLSMNPIFFLEKTSDVTALAEDCSVWRTPV